MSKIATIIIIIIIIAGFGTAAYFLIDLGEKQKEPACTDTNCEEEELKTQEGIAYTDPKGEFSVFLPEEWKNYYEVENKDCEEIPCTVFTYKADDKMDTLLLIINAYPRPESIYAITSLPNTKVIAQTMDTIFTMSQPLDVPYMQGTTDFERYIQMTDQLDEVTKSIKPSSAPYALTQNIREFKDEKLYIDVYYPEIKGQKDYSGINKITKQEMDKFLSEFKKNFEEWGDMDVPEGAYSGFWVDYEPKHLKNDIASIYFLISENLAGAAHPNNYTHSLNFDLKTGKKIELDDLFGVDESEYLEKISELAVADLTKQFEERNALMGETFESGTALKTENYENFNITSQGIVFNFDPYQVASYAVGGFNVLISYDDLNDILEDKFKN